MSQVRFRFSVFLALLAAVAHGSTADIDPEMWTIHDGKLYLNYDREIRSKWLEDKAGNIARADLEWPRLIAD